MELFYIAPDGQKFDSYQKTKKYMSDNGLTGAIHLESKEDKKKKKKEIDERG